MGYSAPALSLCFVWGEAAAPPYLGRQKSVIPRFVGPAALRGLVAVELLLILTHNQQARELSEGVELRAHAGVCGARLLEQGITVEVQRLMKTSHTHQRTCTELTWNVRLNSSLRCSAISNTQRLPLRSRCCLREGSEVVLQ